MQLPTHMRCPHPFTDPDFPPCVESLSVDAIDRESVRWMRGSTITAGGTYARNLFDDVNPNDIVQGDLGDCWLLAAFSAAAEFEGVVERLFITKSFNLQGRYVIKLYDVSVSKWIEVVIDDYIPCHPRRWWDKGGRPMFATPVDNELWCLLLEKAFAKFFGGYGKLIGGYTPYAFQCLTGQEEQWLWCRTDVDRADRQTDVDRADRQIDRQTDKNKRWRRSIVYVDWQKNNPHNCQRMLSQDTDNKIDDEEMFKQLQYADKNNYMMSAFISPNDTHTHTHTHTHTQQRHTTSRWISSHTRIHTLYSYTTQDTQTCSASESLGG
eukprot:GHVR01172682.1.p1 GENE.GHVR01172682.1~~GHVR01172682.1.p1  ORF type:complete len:323 (+),score=104.63 GHVR01172682.1:451-1419(+)